MVRYIFIPEIVKEKIKSHLDNAIEKAIAGFESVYEDEDVLTGYLFGLMKIDEQTVEVDDQEIGGTWKWSIDFKKFGGRGKGATESVLGADGIFELNMNRNGRIEKKSLLFQSKTDWKKKDTSLYNQCTKMLTWLGATTLINYTQKEFETFKIDDVFSNHGEKPSTKNTLKNTLSNDFLDCLIGDSDLHYNAFEKKLIWLDQKNEFVSTKFNINRRLKINIKSPNKYPFEKLRIDKEIPNSEISNHQLMNENANYGIEKVWDKKELSKIQKKVSNTFHPDKHPNLPENAKNMLTEMMKQFNNQFDLQKEKLKRKP